MDKKDARQLIDADLYRYRGDVSFKSFIKNLIVNPGFKYMYYLRKVQYFQERKGHFIFYYLFALLLRRCGIRYGYDIPASVKLGRGFKINHWGSIVINSKANIGDNVDIMTGVIIGNTQRGPKKGAPVIGDNVWIGAHAVIVGNIVIGENVLIAPNTYVNFDVPSNSIVLGNPGVIKRSMHSVEGYIKNKVV